MRDAYLLAAGVLTGLAVPTSTLPGLSLLPAQESNLVPKPNRNSNLHQQAQAQISTVNSRFGNLPEASEPEFSDSPTHNSTAPQLFNKQTQPSVYRRPVSGNQLYHQRLAALRLGQIYTRINNEPAEYAKIQKLSSRQLTYEDWKNLLALEAKAMGNGQGSNGLSIMVGDSLSLWYPKDKLPEGKLWLNQGISGDTSAGILKRLTYFQGTNPDVIYVMAGVNDLRRGTSDRAILSNLRLIMKRLRKSHPQAQIIVKSILPTRMPKIPNARIVRLNEQIAKIAQAENVSYLNIHAWFIDGEGKLRQELTTDGLHLSMNGYQVWQAAIQQVETKIAASQMEQQRRKFLKEQAEAAIRKSRLIGHL